MMLANKSAVGEGLVVNPALGRDAVFIKWSLITVSRYI